MKTITKPPIAMNYALRTTQAPLNPRVDRERGIIFGAALIQLGDINDDRQVFVDEKTLQQTLSLSKSRVKGQKSRFTHPNMSNDGLGKFLGRWKNHRLSDDGNSVLADLHISPLARRGQNSRGEYTLDMAEQEPDMFGVSLAPRWDEEEMRKLRRDDGKMPLRFVSIAAADVVDEAAATRGGFFGDADLSIATAPHAATRVLDSLFADAEPEVIRARCGSFLDTYLANRFTGQQTPKEDDMSQENESKLSKDDVQGMIDAAFAKSLAASEERVSKILEGYQKEADKPSAADEALAERTRCKELYALAQNSGLADALKLADGWIEKGLSVIEAKAGLGDLAIAQNKLTSDSGGGNEDPDAKYRKEYQAHQAAFATQGLSLADYIYSRKVDDGSALLAPTAKE